MGNTKSLVVVFVGVGSSEHVYGSATAIERGKQQNLYEVKN